jgi:hypothetical protein
MVALLGIILLIMTNIRWYRGGCGKVKQKTEKVYMVHVFKNKIVEKLCQLIVEVMLVQSYFLRFRIRSRFGQGLTQTLGI